jgi:hypothetical protein
MDVARPGLGDAALGAARQIDVARSHDRDVGGLGGVGGDPLASMSPEPAILMSTLSAWPAAVTPPDPAIDRLTLPPVTDGRRRSPDPATSPSKSPATLSTVIPPDPAMAAARKAAALTVNCAVPFDQFQRKPLCFLGRISSVSPSTTTSVSLSRFSPPRAVTPGAPPVTTLTSYGPATSIFEKAPTW